MRFPEELRAAIDAETGLIPRRDLAQAVAELTNSYRREVSAAGSLIDTPPKLGAYLQVRMPATFAANLRVFQEVTQRMPSWSPRSLLDLGAGPGTAMWAAAQVFPSIEDFRLVERDKNTLEAGKRLAASSRQHPIQSSTWLESDIAKSVLADADLVVVSYAIGELTGQQQKSAVASAWSAARKVLAIVGPGTPVGYEAMLAARAQLLEGGACIVAPCPHGLQCPLANGKDWCHFSQRLQRTSDHRRLKSGELGYEDEKFTYLVAGRTDAQKASARILRHPLKHSGHVQLSLCTASGLQQLTVTRSQKEQYKHARKAEWGEAWDLKPTSPGATSK